MTTPDEETVSVAPMSPAGINKFLPIEFVNNARGDAPTIRHTVPMPVADIRVNPPTPSIARDISGDAGALRYRYWIPKLPSTLPDITPEPDTNRSTASAI